MKDHAQAEREVRRLIYTYSRAVDRLDRALLAAFAGAALASGATWGLMRASGPVSTGAVREALLADPDMIPAAMERLQARETGKAIAANRAVIETPYAGAWEGAKDADVTVVQFFDYACGYCRAALPDIDRLLREDRKLRVVYRELPVLGPDSEAAAFLSLGAARQGRYPEFHRAMYAAGRPDAAARARLAASFRVPAAQTPEAAQELSQNLQLQQALRIAGTPAWIVGDRVLNGNVGYDALKRAIAEVRAERG
jgi:protein-disulfide isomerase